MTEGAQLHIVFRLWRTALLMVKHMILPHCYMSWQLAFLTCPYLIERVDLPTLKLACRQQGTLLTSDSSAVGDTHASTSKATLL